MAPIKMTPIQERILDSYRVSIKSLLTPVQQADLIRIKAGAMGVGPGDVENYLKLHGLA